MSNPANVSELRSPYRPPTAAPEPTTSCLVSNLESATVLGYQWATLLAHADVVTEWGAEVYRARRLALS
jgi:hypothetical protein